MRLIPIFLNGVGTVLNFNTDIINCCRCKKRIDLHNSCLSPAIFCNHFSFVIKMAVMCVVMDLEVNMKNMNAAAVHHHAAAKIDFLYLNTIKPTLKKTRLVEIFAKWSVN